MRKWMIFVAAAALAFSLSPAMTQPKDKPPPKPRSQASLECSKQADARGLKGKERKKFRRKCMRDLKKTK